MTPRTHRAAALEEAWEEGSQLQQELRGLGDEASHLRRSISFLWYRILEFQGGRRGWSGRVARDIQQMQYQLGKDQQRLAEIAADEPATWRELQEALGRLAPKIIECAAVPWILRVQAHHHMHSSASVLACASSTGTRPEPSSSASASAERMAEGPRTLSASLSCRR